MEKAQPSTNPIDLNSECFDPISFINRNIAIFDCNKLNKLAESTMKEQIAIQKSVFETLQKQDRLEEEATKSLRIAPDKFNDVRQSLNSLNGDTQYTEALLKGICDGVTLLGLARTNIGFVVKLLHHLQQLDVLIQTCEQALKDNLPLSAADSLRTAKLIIETYADVKDVDVFATTIMKLHHLCNDIITITKEVVVQFESNGSNKRQMRDYFSLVDELFDEYKHSFISYLATHLTLGYTNAFPLNAPQSSLSNIDQRYKWFLDKIKVAKYKYDNTLPSSWRFWEVMAQDFCATSKESFHELLEKSSKGDAELFTTCLVKAIRTTRAFENEILKRVSTNNDKPLIFEGIIGKCFDGYMDFYIEKERENVMTFLNKFIKEEFFEVDDGVVVLLSSKDLILYYRKCSERCASLTRGEPLMELCKVIASCTVEYAKSLQQRMSTTNKREMIKRQCLVINTLKYIYFRIERLLTVSFAELGEEIKEPMTNMQSGIIKIVGEIVEQLVVTILKPVDDIMTNMTKENWSPVEGETNWEIDYVDKMTICIKKNMGVIDDYLVNDYYLQICELTTALFCEKYIDTLFKLKRINEFGAQMLLMDYSQGKNFFLKLPNRKNPITLDGIGDTSVKNTSYDLNEYSTECSKEYSKAEGILKILQITDKDKAMSTCQYFFPEMSSDFFPKVWALRDNRMLSAVTSKLNFSFYKGKKEQIAKAFSTILN
ncbi:hypothetical protein ENU1_083370 [Entamoeba nuttalli P19]|uniref:Vps53 N-terminal domain-containing protein n=2 Tax=Entamoeba nuttalli TaxID=412467 RepID=K2GZS2_ENTNP|nr:hypothetical protein ENU1_083370 [Entamoeba nuttalli P19]EKE40673.1 hypothetical protein ENU1_083370 [Entamoeba nuttalli P19]|eukprot:XP_008856997.1 hypothetical protein ENU1_083370 [Entamoeba nuttalli P19]